MSLKPSNRLPDTIRPTVYHINLKVDPEKKQFSGEVAIELELLESIRHLRLHALGLEIGNARIEKSGVSQTPNPTLEPSSESVRFEFSREIKLGPAKVSIQFKGQLNDQLRGLYRVKVGGETYAFTQLEATDARRVFPCFDEPAFKARFQLCITIPKNLTALSNMPVIEEKPEGAMKTVSFGETPVMSSYLLALGIARFESKEIQVGQTRVCVFTPRGQLSLGDFSLKVTAAVLPLLNDYFDLPYPYPKLDLVCVPDFAMGAMENWGAIFFRDSLLLVDESTASTSTLRDAANVITHEIVHQWFGNLVTMVWWDDLWLNESFATWLACKIVDQWRPEWNSWLEFQQQKQPPLSIDALKATRPIQAQVENAAQIEEMFDALTYEKGAACLRMIENFLGEREFREGIRRYIKKYSFQNAVAQDLWTELERASGQPVSAIAHDWFTQPGFPLITAKATHSDLRHLSIVQQRFFAMEPSRPGPQLTWTVPLTIRFGNSKYSQVHREIIKNPSTELGLPGDKEIDWICINADESGFFRTRYDANLQSRLLSVASHHLNPAERIGFLNHLWALCLKGEAPINVFMDALCHFKGDSTRVVIEALTSYLETLSDQLVLSSDKKRFQKFVLNLLSPLWSRLGWDKKGPEDDEIRLSRASVLWALGSIAEEEEILSELPRKLTLFWGRTASVEPTLVEPVLRLSIRTDGGSLFKAYTEKITTAPTPEDRDRYLGALADYKKPELARKILEYTLSDNIRSQDFWRPVRLLLGNPWVQEETWLFVKENWELMRKKGGSVAAQRIIQGTKKLWRNEWRQDVDRFFNDPINRVPAATKALEQTLELMELGILFKDRQQSTLSDWLNNQTQ